MFFSVKRVLKILKKVYIPCVCYPLPEYLEATIEKLCNEDKATIYENRVFFQSGKLITKEPELKKVPETKKRGKRK